MTFENAYFTLEVFRNNLEFFHSKRSMKKNMDGASPNLAHDKLSPAKTKWHIFYEPVLRLHYHFQVTELEPWKLKQMSSTQSVLNSCFVLSTHILESKKRLYFRIDAVVSPCVIVWGGLPQCLIIGRHSSPLH